jgi:DNA modification methylase
MEEIICGDALTKLKNLPDGIIQTCITSPPYWGLRDYGVEGQIGLEPSPEEYVSALVEIMREVKRVLRDDGTLWLVLGDSYAGSWGDSGHRPERTGIDGVQREKNTDWYKRDGHPRMNKPPTVSPPGLKPKDLVGIPWRVAFALQEDGWWLRSDIIWAKPNPMPESVSDRPTSAHEHIFLMTKSPKYYYDQDAIREPRKEESKKRAIRGTGEENKYADGTYFPDHKLSPQIVSQPRKHLGYDNMEEKVKSGETVLHPLGANKRNVWTINTESFSEAHFATFPTNIVEPCILAGSSRQACPKCGTPWVRVVERTVVEPLDEKPYQGQRQLRPATMGPGSQGNQSSSLAQPEKVARKLGDFIPGCKCENNDGTGKSVVMDPFAGSGTTGLVAVRLGRSFVGIDLNSEYCDMMKRRLKEIQTTLFD